MKIPLQAKKVFTGKIFDVYQWEQEMYDGSTHTFEMLKRPATVQVIPVAGNEILLSYEEQPMKPRSYSLFGGRQEPGEDPLVCAKRELLEETGFESDDWELYRQYEFPGKIDWTVYLYIARGCRKVAEQHLDAGEKIEIKPVSFETFLDIVTDEKFWGQEISNHFLRLQQDKIKLEAFRKHLFE